MKIVLHTEANPQDNAMLQALYSRSPKSVTEHLERLSKAGSGKFMEQYYVGYGHNSIADCGFVTMYFEGISMLAAKALEDNPLYNGQECSSRYIDFSSQPFYNPYIGTEYEDEAETLLAAYRKFYVSQLPEVKLHLLKSIPREGYDESTYDKAINAKVFDILRGYLPCGSTTNVSVTFSLRKAREHLALLAYHPLIEISTMAQQGYAQLCKAYPSSFPELALDKGSYDAMVENFYTNAYSLAEEAFELQVSEGEFLLVEAFSSPIGDKLRNSGLTALNGRPERHTPHKHDLFYKTNFVHIAGGLDFGSFRDLQRHRGGYCSMPVVDSSNEFNPWYVDQMPPESMLEVVELLDLISDFQSLIISEFMTDDQYLAAKLTQQYMLPMGTNVEVDYVCDYKQAVYLTELRTGQTVHPTLRKFMQGVAAELECAFCSPQTYADMEPDKFSIKRGKQDITEVNTK